MADEKYSDKVKPYIDDIAVWTACGSTQKQIAARLGVSLSALKNYRAEHSELDEALSFGKSNISMDIEKTLADLALGYNYYTSEVVKLKNCDGSERAEVKTVKKYVPPNLEAAKYYLKNRCKKKWSDNPHGNDFKDRELKMKQQINELPSSAGKVEIYDDIG